MPIRNGDLLQIKKQHRASRKCFPITYESMMLLNTAPLCLEIANAGVEKSLYALQL